LWQKQAMPHSPLRNSIRIAALVVAVGATACSQEPPNNEANASETAEPKTGNVVEDSALPDLPLDRQGLLIAMLQASSAAINGASDAKQQEALKGRRFEVRMRFGCPGGSTTLERRWSHDKASDALRVSVRPELDHEIGAPVGESDAQPPARHERGFLVPSPTLLSAGCPNAEYAAAQANTNLRFGIVQRTDPQGARSRQLLESYEVTKKIAPEQVPPEGLDLIVRGRLETGGEGPIRCAPRGGIAECLALSTIDLVSIEDPSNGRLIAEWGQN
jgi:hypothetical protein